MILLGWLIYFVIFGTIGALLARHDKLPSPDLLGAVIGGLIPGGILFLLGVWLAEWFVAKLGGRTA